MYKVHVPCTVHEYTGYRYVRCMYLYTVVESYYCSTYCTMYLVQGTYTQQCYTLYTGSVLTVYIRCMYLVLSTLGSNYDLMYIVQVRCTMYDVLVYHSVALYLVRVQGSATMYKYCVHYGVICTMYDVLVHVHHIVALPCTSTRYDVLCTLYDVLCTYYLCTQYIQVYRTSTTRYIYIHY